MKTKNPAFNQKALQTMRQYAAIGESMTIQGTINKSLIMLGLVGLTFFYTWNKFMTSQNPASIMPLFFIGIIGGFIFAMITTFKMEWAPITAPIYALLEGLVLGGLSAMLEIRFPGIALQAVSLTFGILFSLLLAYQSGKIRATPKFKRGVIIATGGIMAVYLLSFILSFFGMGNLSIFGTGVMGIGFSLIVVVIAALNLILDFDFIETAAREGYPKFIEWYGAFGLMVTLIWLYIEILRLLSLLRSR
jgi:uncharacterized YccA/Bax inhibitor family protein